MSVYLSKRKCAIMEGSSETGWNSSSRGLNYSSVVDRNPRVVVGGSSVRSSSDASPDSASIPARKGREGMGLLPYIDCIKPQGGVSGDGLGLGLDDNRDVSLRQWLDNPERTVDSLECLHIFTQIVDIVNLAHSQGIVVHNVRPSCFVMSSFNRVAFIESASCSHSGSESLEDGLNSETAEFKGASSPGARDFEQEKQAVTQRLEVEMNCANAMQTLEADKNQQAEEKQQHSFPMKQILLLETNWYTSPEEVSGEPSICASDVYRLGVLLFELFCTFHSPEEKSATMSSLRHRVLPPQLLLKWPKEASFCLWLLHPQPSSRPNLGELLQSEFLNDPRESLEEWEAAIALREKIDEQDLLLEFLLLTQQRKQEVADSLNEIISFLSSDLEGVTNMQSALRTKGDSNLDQGKKSASNRGNIAEDDDSGSSRSRKRSRVGFGTCNVEETGDRADEHETRVESQGSFLSKSSRLMKNFRKLESAYFLTRRRALKPTAKPLSRYSQISSDGRGSIVATERSSVSNLSSKGGRNEETQSGWINSFLEGLCKYMSFSKLEEKANLKQGDLLNSSNLVCSLSFDRDGEFFATAGVNKKIKVFEYNSILKQDRDIHYPVVEMSSRSKLSSICWNSYVKSQIASSNFEGVVQVWDVTRSQLFMEMKEHERRVWSVDFSVADPTLLASGSDDGTVKLWNINQAILLLHLVDVSFETKRRLCRDHQNESERVLRSVPFRFWSFSCVWLS
ncbi:protein SPA1-RELATED 3 isoform X2 [Ipomoea triloba]|uniref:protein SPA1-RELATED 3 isoform X2 n=1 Tax=Ipomoea triloba TaxID=35885 RepID=UPI00125D5646|nr:protein SPA1-RELATED 3 isoform X2 [Ipomoea triloba]